MGRKFIPGRVFAGTCLAAAVLFAGCGQSAPEQELHVIVENSNDKIQYNFLLAEIGDVTVTRTVRCTYRQQQDQPVSFAITGRLVDKVYVKEGERVKKGTLLAELSAGTLEDQIEDLEYYIARNELLLKHSETNEALERSHAWVNYLYNHFTNEEGNQRNLDAIGQRYQYQREDCEDALEVDRAKLAKLKKELSNCRVYAQMDGSVYKLARNLEGSTSKAEQVVMTIVDDSQCLFEMKSPENAPYFPEGVPVSMKVASGSAAGEYEILPYDRENWGEIQQFSVLSGPMTTGIEVGTEGVIEFATESRKGVLCVPKEAVNAADDKYFVYVTDEDNMKQVRWVEVGLFGDTSVEILSGLTEGERVVR